MAKYKMKESDNLGGIFYNESKKKWRVQISFMGDRYSGGSYKKIKEAKEAKLKLLKKLRKETVEKEERKVVYN